MPRTRIPAPFAWLIGALLLIAPLTGAVAQTPEASPQASPVASPVATPEVALGINPADMDLTVDPAEDFYQFANGGWLARTELPADEAAYGVFNEIGDRVTVQLNETIDGLEADSETDTGKVRTVYDQVLDTEARNANGIEPIRPILDSVLAIDSIEAGLAYQQGSYADDNMFGLFIPYGQADPADATTVMTWLYGPFLNLPSTSYYLDESEEGQAIRDAWIDTTAQLLMQLGYAEAEATTAAEAVMAFEMELAAIVTPEEVMFTDPNAQNNPRTIAELEEILPAFDWEAFLAENGIESVETVNVSDIAYLEGLGEVLENADPLILQYVFAAELIWGFSGLLTTEIEEIAFSFQGPVLFGISEQQPIDERALDLVKGLYPHALGKAYVDLAFPPEAKEQVEDLVDNLIAAFAARIEQSTWMSEETKVKALEKLDLLSVKVGYPDQWDTYENVPVGDSLFESAFNAFHAQTLENLETIGEPVDRNEWLMGAFEVNAYYNPSLNEIVFPAAILQAPFFDANADLATNYGGIGAVIGHEITHGFDLGGSQYDGYGNLVSWWTEDDYAAFQALNDQVIAHFDEVEVMPGLMANGEISVRENVADMGGVQVAYDALLIALDSGGHSLNPDAAQDTPWFLTQQQRFLIAWATNWRAVASPEYVAFLVTSDSHAPAPARGVEPLRHLDEFHEAFNIGEGDAEYLPPEERVVIW
jgi:predicted metalloendopeptidase